MAEQIAFNTRDYSWADVEIRLLDNSVVGAVGFQYIKRQLKTNIYGRGTKPIRRTRGNKEYEGSITLLQSELEALQDLAKASGLEDPVDFLPFSVAVSYENAEGVITTDILLYCEFIEIPKGMAQNDPNMEIELPLIIGDIKYAA